MIGYVTLGTNRYDDAAKLYDELFAVIDAGRIMESDTFFAISTATNLMRSAWLKASE